MLATLVTAALLGGAAAAAPGTVVLEATGFRSDTGQACVALFRTPEGFPAEHSKAFRLETARIEGGRARLSLAGLEPGEYAISLFHDEDSDFVIDSNFLGIPKEGVGASNNAKGRFGPPKFRDALFRVLSGPQAMSVRVVYVGG